MRLVPNSEAVCRGREVIRNYILYVPALKLDPQVFALANGEGRSESAAL